MKGLIIKDLMCIRKQAVVFAYIVTCVLVLSVMFVLSTKNGNIAKAGQEMLVENDMSDIDVKNLSTNVLILFLLLPIALVGDIASIIVADEKADFKKISTSLPITIEKRVLAKYLTVCSMFGIGILVDVVISFILSILTDIISFKEFVGIILSAASILFLYCVLVLLYSFWLGMDKVGLAQVCSIITIIAGFVIVKFNYLKTVFTQIFSYEATQEDVNFLTDIMDFVKYKSYIVLIIAIVAALISYGLSVVIAKRKRGII